MLSRAGLQIPQGRQPDHNRETSSHQRPAPYCPPLPPPPPLQDLSLSTRPASADFPVRSSPLRLRPSSSLHSGGKVRERTTAANATIAAMERQQQQPQRSSSSGGGGGGLLRSCYSLGARQASEGYGATSSSASLLTRYTQGGESMAEQQGEDGCSCSCGVAGCGGAVSPSLPPTISKEDKIIERYMRMLRSTSLTPSVNYSLPSAAAAKPPRPCRCLARRPSSTPRPARAESSPPEQVALAAVVAGGGSGSSSITTTTPPGEPSRPGAGGGAATAAAAVGVTNDTPGGNSPAPSSAPPAFVTPSLASHLSFPLGPSARIARSNSWTQDSFPASSSNSGSSSGRGLRTPPGAVAGLTTTILGSNSSSGGRAAAEQQQQQQRPSPPAMYPLSARPGSASSSSHVAPSPAGAAAGAYSAAGSLAASSLQRGSISALIPRVAYLAGQKQAKQVLLQQQQQQGSYLDQQLLAMRMKTSAMLSNRYVSLPITDTHPQQHGGPDQRQYNRGIRSSRQTASSS